MSEQVATQEKKVTYHDLILHIQALAKVVHPYHPEQWKGELKGRWWPSILHRYGIEFDPHDNEDLTYDWIMILWHGLIEHEKELFERVGSKRNQYVKDEPLTEDQPYNPF